MRKARGEGREPAFSFPMLVTFGACAVALLLFLTNTAPALHEQRLLEQVELRMTQQRREYVRRLLNLRRYNSRDAASSAFGDLDAQALLVSIDRLGLTPAELLALHPDDREAAADTVDRQRLRHVRGN